MKPYHLGLSSTLTTWLSVVVLRRLGAGRKQITSVAVGKKDDNTSCWKRWTWITRFFFAWICLWPLSNDVYIFHPKQARCFKDSFEENNAVSQCVIVSQTLMVQLCRSKTFKFLCETPSLVARWWHSCFMCRPQVTCFIGEEFWVGRSSQILELSWESLTHFRSF